MKTIELEAALGTGAAAGLIEALRESRGAELRLDASKVESLGAACLQALLAGAAAWKQDGAKLTLAAPSEAFRADAATMGAAALLAELEEAAA